MALSTSAPPYDEPLRRHGWAALVALFVVGAIAAGAGLAIGEVDALYTTLAIALCIGMLIDFRIGVVVLMLIVPFSRTAYFPHGLLGINGLNPLNVMVAGTLAAWFLQRGGGRGFAGFLPAPLLWLFIVPIMLGMFMGMQHVDEIPGFLFEDNSMKSYVLGAVKPLLIVVSALLVGAAVAASRKPERFLIPVVLAMWPMALLQIGFFILSGANLGAIAGRYSRDFYEPLGLHANELGRFHMVAYAFLLFAWWEAKNPAIRRFLFVTMGVVLLALLLTFSRAAFLGLLLASGMFMFWKFNMRTMSLALLVAALAIIFLPGYFYQRATMGFDEGLNSVSAGRVDGIWLPLLPELAKSPIWGNGLEAIKWSEPMRTGAMGLAGHPHNAYLEAMLDMGLLGLALLLGYYWHVWKGFGALWANRELSPELRGYFQGGLAALGTFLVTGISGSSLRPEAEFAYLWAAIGMMIGLAARKPAS